MTRKKRENSKAKGRVSDNVGAEGSVRNEGQPNQRAVHLSSQSTRVLVQHPPLETPEPHPTSAGYFQGSNGVEIHGGRFNQTMGHHTNVTIHVNGREHEPLVPSTEESSRIPTPQFPVPANLLPDAYPVQHEITRVSYSPDNSNKIYERHLGVKQRGFPLWIPEPNMRLPLPYRRTGINIGDVGIITPSGGFSFLFNICRPSGDPINPPLLPEDFSPIYPPLSPTDVREFLEFKPQSYLASSTIELINNDPPFLGLSFQTSSAEGAILTIPEGALTLDLENIPRFRAYAAANIEKWYRYVNGPRGREAKNGEVRLVIGCDKTKAWGMAAVANMTQHKVHHFKFRSVEDPLNPSNTIPLYRWEYSGLAEARVGPDSSEIEALSHDDDSTTAVDGRYCNQCVFVRTLNMSLKDEVYEAINRDVEAALIEQYHQQYGPESNTSSSCGRHADASTQTGGSDGVSSTPGSSLQEKPDHSTVSQLNSDRVTTSVSASASKFHPADAINKALLEKAPTSWVAITEDLDWSSVFTENDRIMPAANEIVARVFASHDIKEENGIAFFEPKNGLRRRGQMIASGEHSVTLTHTYPPASSANNSASSWPSSNELAAPHHMPSVEIPFRINSEAPSRPSFESLRRRSQPREPVRLFTVTRAALVYINYVLNASWFWSLLALLSFAAEIMVQVQGVSPRLRSISHAAELVITILCDADIASYIYETWRGWRMYRVPTWLNIISATGSTILLAPGVWDSEMHSWLTIFPLIRLHRLTFVLPGAHHFMKSFNEHLNCHAHVALILVICNYAVAILFIRQFIEYDALGPKLSGVSTGIAFVLALGGPLWLIFSNVYIFRVFWSLVPLGQSYRATNNVAMNEGIFPSNASLRTRTPRVAQSMRRRNFSSISRLRHTNVPTPASRDVIDSLHWEALSSDVRYDSELGDIRRFRYPLNPVTRFCQRLTKPAVVHGFFRRSPSAVPHFIFKLVLYSAVICTIILNSIVSVDYRLQHPGPYLNMWFGRADLTLCIIFSVEVAVKTLADGVFVGPNGYLRRSLNVVDFIITLSSWFTFIAFATTPVQRNPFVRSLRALLVIRLATLSESMSRAIETILVTKRSLIPVLLAFMYTLPFATWYLVVSYNYTGVTGLQQYELAYTVFSFMPGFLFLALFISFLGRHNSKVGHMTRAKKDWEEVRVFLNRQKFSTFYSHTRLPTSSLRGKCLYVTSHDTWQVVLNLSLIMILVLYAFEQLLYTFLPIIKFAVSIVPLADVALRIIALGLRNWKEFTFDIIISTGNFAAAVKDLYSVRDGLKWRWDGLFLFGILFKFLYRNQGFRMFLRTAFSCYPSILSFFGLWMTNLCFIVLAVLQYFAIKTTNGHTLSAIGKILSTFVLGGSGTRWVILLEECDVDWCRASTIWPYILLIIWHVTNILISVYVYDTFIFDRFLYIGQFFGKTPKSVSSDDIQAFKRSWAKFANAKSGLLEKHSLSQFFLSLIGPFEVRIFPTRYSTPNILRQCRPHISTSDPNSIRAMVTDRIDVDKLSSILNTLDTEEIRRRKFIYSCIYYEALEQASQKGITFTGMLLLIARYKLAGNKHESMSLDESTHLSDVDMGVQDCLDLDRVQSTLRMIILRRRFLAFRSERMGSLLVAEGTPDFSIAPTSLSGASVKVTPGDIHNIASSRRRLEKYLGSPTSILGLKMPRKPSDADNADTKLDTSRVKALLESEFFKASGS